MERYAIRGNILYTPRQKELKVLPNAYAVCQDGLCMGAYLTLPKEYKDIFVLDYGDALIIPV